MSRAAVRVRGPTAAASLAIPMLGMLAIELLLGMALNLFVTVPTGSPVSVLLSSPILVLHVLLGVLLLGIAARAVVLSIRASDRGSLGASLLAFVSVVAAFLAGLSFVFYGQTSASSYAMTVGFTGAFLGAALILWRGRATQSPRPTGSDVTVPTSGGSP
jgi:hypothetical protein